MYVIAHLQKQRQHQHQRHQHHQQYSLHNVIIGAPSRYWHAVLKLAGVCGAIGVRADPLAVALAFAICLAGVRNCAVIGTLSICRPPVLPRAGVGAAVTKLHGALAILLAVLPLAGVLAAIGPRQRALAVALAAFPSAAIIGAIGVRHGAFPVAFAGLPRAGVCEKY